MNKEKLMAYLEKEMKEKDRDVDDFYDCRASDSATWISVGYSHAYYDLWSKIDKGEFDE